MLHISYRRFCSVQCTAHRERERYLGWYGTAQPQEYSGVGCVRCVRHGAPEAERLLHLQP